LKKSILVKIRAQSSADPGRSFLVYLLIDASPMFRFTIRDVLWLTVVVAFAVGWWIDRDSLISEFQSRLVELRGFVVFANPDIAEPLEMRPGDRAIIEMDRDGVLKARREDSAESIKVGRPRP